MYSAFDSAASCRAGGSAAGGGRRKEKNAEEAAEAAPRSPKTGPARISPHEEMVLHIRCTTEQRDTFARMGGSVWFRSFLDTLQAGFDRDVNSSSGEED